MLRIYGVEKDRVHKNVNDLTEEEKIELVDDMMRRNINEVYTLDRWFYWLNEGGIDLENYYWFALDY